VGAEQNGIAPEAFLGDIEQNDIADAKSRMQR
jgi:hypothetical protein